MALKHLIWWFYPEERNRFANFRITKKINKIVHFGRSFIYDSEDRSCRIRMKICHLIWWYCRRNYYLCTKSVSYWFWIANVLIFRTGEWGLFYLRVGTKWEHFLTLKWVIPHRMYSMRDLCTRSRSTKVKFWLILVNY